MNAHAFIDVDDRVPPDDVERCEMANLSEAETGVPGVIWVSTRMGQHGPRVKYFTKPSARRASFVVSIAKEPAVVASSASPRMLARMSPLVIEWVRLNRVALRTFWDEGERWSIDQIVEWRDGLTRLGEES